MKLLDIKDEKLVAKTGNSVKLTFDKETKSYPIYRVNLDLLYYNEYNDRIATWIENYEANSENEPFEGMDEIKRNKIIESFIIGADPKRLNTTKNNIKLVSQKVPGVVLNDGRVIDGNRRFTCLRMLREENPDSREFDYFETAILDLDIKDDRKAIKILELNLQHATDEKADYDLIDFAIGTYRTVEVDKTLSIADYIIYSGEQAADVRERIELAKLMNEYLEFIKMPGQYNYLREKQAYSFFQEFLRPLRKCKSDEEKEALKRMAFTNYMVGSFADVRKYCRDITSIMGTNYYDDLLENQKEIIKDVQKAKDKAQIEDRKSFEKFVGKQNSEKQELADITEDIIKASKISKIKTTPSTVINKCITELRGIDTRLFASLNDDELNALKKDMEILQKTIDRINTEVSKLS